jgi:GTP cyclohydrolase-4
MSQAPPAPSTAAPARGLPDQVPDVQARPPSVRIGLSRVGVTGVEKVIRVHDELYSARIDCFVDLGAAQKGAHMSRFEEVINEAIGEVLLNEDPLHAELLACQIAERIRSRQEAERAEVRIAARYPEHKPAPISGTQTQEIYTLLGRASASAHGTRRVVGVQATGMTACPCAQELVAGRAREELAEAGFSAAQIEQIFACVPVATHNQRGIGTLAIGFPERAGASAEAIDATVLLAIVEEAMSSEIYELMKRSDEAEVVAKAHRRPRFVEDCVREMIAGAMRRLADLPDESFLAARQENLETIHQHNVVAERHGLFGDLRAELQSGRAPRGELTLEGWLAQRAR